MTAQDNWGTFLYFVESLHTLSDDYCSVCGCALHAYISTHGINVLKNIYTYTVQSTLQLKNYLKIIDADLESELYKVYAE